MTGGADVIGSAMLCIEPGVVEGRSQPGDCCVASSAGGGEAGGGVVWVGGSGEVHLVAGVAVGWGSHKDIVDVA